MKKYLKILVITLIIGIMLTYTNISVATDKQKLQNQQSNLDSSISEAKDELEDIKKEKSQTLSEVESLIEQVSNYEDEIDSLNDQISGLQTKIKNVEKQIKEDEEEYKKQQTALDDRLVTMYENGDISYLDVLLSSESLTDFISKYYLVSELTTYDTDMLKQVEEEKKKIENEKMDLENSKKSLDNAKQTKTAKASALKVAEKEKEQKASKLSQEEKATQKEIEEMQADRAAIDKELKKIAIEEQRRREEAKKNSNKGNSSSPTYVDSTPSSSGYIFPVAGLSKANIRVKAYPSYPGHTGVDVNIGVAGRSVVAVKDGTVQVSEAKRKANGEYKSYGEYIIINHHDGTMTLYGHMLAGSRRVSKGQSVKQGQVIGTVGSTGNSTGTHLHFEVRTLANSYRAVNPLPYLP